MIRLIESWIRDAHYSARRLTARPGYVLLTVLTLALGAGGTAAIFSIVRPLLLQPLPVTREQEIGVLWMPGDWTEQEFSYLRPKFQGFRGMAAYRDIDATLDRPGQPLRFLHGAASSAELFDVLGAPPLLGRTFRPGDDLVGAEPTVVLSHRLWRDLGGDPRIIGQRMMLGGTPQTVIGVMPPGFWFPDPATRLWTAAPMRTENRVGNYTLIGRAEASSLEHMNGALGAIVSRLRERFTYPPQWDKTRAPQITPLRQHLVGGLRAALLATLAAMALILCMACVNVSALMLGQVGGRGSELAVRVALGAGRRQLVQQLVVEALALGLIAGTAGALLAALGFQTLVRALPLGVLAETARVDWSLFAGATLVGVVSAVLVSLVPALVVWRGDLNSSLSGTRTAGLSPRGGKLEGGLVVGQVAVAVLLTVGAGLLLKSVANLRDIDPGLRTERVGVLDATIPSQLTTEEQRAATLDFLPVLRSIPGIRSVAATQKLPLRGTGDSWGITIEGRPDLPTSTTYFRIVSQDYFKTMGIRVRRGRDFQPSDTPASQRVVIINEALAKKYFPGQDPIGRLVHTGFGEKGEQVVGVVSNVAEANLTDEAAPARYMLYDQIPVARDRATFVIAAERAEALPGILETAHRLMRDRAPRLAFESATTMGQVFTEAVGPPGQVAILLALLAGLALLLGAIGVYGMISQFVLRRTREYGIRMALGLEPRRVVTHVLKRGLRLVALGSVLGIVSALLLGRLLSSLLYGVRSADPQALAAAVIALVLVGSAAAFVPARRASRTDPIAVLREQ